MSNKQRQLALEGDFVRETKIGELRRLAIALVYREDGEVTKPCRAPCS